MNTSHRIRLNMAASFYLAAACVAAASGGAAKPNILVILADDMGYAEMGCQGNKDVPTPNIDSLARSGVRFTNGYVTCPICAPTRAGLMTGRYQQRFGFETNPGPEEYADEKFGLPRNEATLAERLKAAGYATGMFGKWHLGYKPELQPTARGFDEFFGFLSGANNYLPEGRRGQARNPVLRGTREVEEREYLTDAFGREAVAFIDANHARPFFLYLPFNAVHAPMEATDKYRARFASIADEKRRAFAAMLSAMDDNIGRVLGALRKYAIEEQTLIFFLSDNGGPTTQTTSSNLPLSGYKGQVLEGGIREPFILQWKGRLPAGLIDDRPVISLDIHPTALAAAGVPISPEWKLDGVNLLPFLTGENNGAPHETLYWRFHDQRAIRRGDWKMVQTRSDPKPRLFNLASDIAEKDDLADKEPAKLQELADAWQAWNAQLMDPLWIRQDSRTEDGGDQRRPRGSVGPAPGGGGLDERFKELDVNGDGKVSREEGSSLRFFAAADANRDGALTPNEVRAYFSGRKGAPRAKQAPTESPAPRAAPAAPKRAPEPPPGAARSTPSGSTSNGLDAADAIFELCARDVTAVAKFYRDGLGMREVEAADPQKGALLEWAGSYLRIRPTGASRNESTPEPGGRALMKQMLAKNGFRWFSLWYEDLSATEERLVKAGYGRPAKGGNVSMTRDPEGNIVEIMRVPRSASGETFTWGMAVSDEAAARKFYGAVLGLKEFDPWNLPPPFSMKMYLFQTGNGRIKFSVPPGQRPNEADAGPDAPGLRSVTLRVADLAAARAALVQRGAKLEERDGRLLVADPDGNRCYIEAVSGGPPPAPKPSAAAPASAAPSAQSPQPSATPAPGSAADRWAAANPEELFRLLDRDNDGRISAEELPRAELLSRVDRDGDGFASPAEVRAYYAQQGGGAPAKPITEEPPTPFLAPAAPGEPPLKPLPDSDASRDAAGRGQMFESIHVANVTDLRAGMNGLAIADLNGDGLLDIVATFSPVRGSGGRWGKGELLRVFVNEGDFRFRTHEVKLKDSEFTLDDFGRGQVPGLADFNNDGFLDLFVTRHARMEAGKRAATGVDSPGNSLFLADGAWDVFREVSDAMGIRNEQAYNRQPCFGDVNRDGFLDIAIGCDNIKNALGGVPHSRLYVFQSRSRTRESLAGGMKAGERFEDGDFEDIGGTDIVPDFGGFYHDSAKDKAGPDINLRDLDNDGDLDLIQSFHVDVREPLLPYWPGEYRQGVFCWKNLLAETGALKFEKITGNGLACEARLKYDREKQIYVPEGKAPGLPYVSMADVDNDGLMDVLAVGPASQGWAPRAEYVGGRFWHNLGGFKFEARTGEAGFEALEWTFRDWVKFFDMPVDEASLRTWPGKLQTQPGMDRPHPLDNRPYFADAAFADFNNDGWIDVVVQDRHEGLAMPARAILFMNRGDGTFEPKPTTFSGLDGNGICLEPADLNSDGLVDLIMAADPDNSGVATTPDRYESKVYWNTGLHGGKENHWLRLRFSGVSHAELIGARVEVTVKSSIGNLPSSISQYRWIHPNHSYKSGGALEAHFGLGKETEVDVKVMLPGGKAVSFAAVKADRPLELNLNRATISVMGTPK